MKEEDLDRIWKYVMSIGIMAILIASAMVVSEVHSARKHCKSIDGNYSLNIIPFHHKCNDAILFHYDSEWGFEIPNATLSIEE